MAKKKKSSRRAESVLEKIGKQVEENRQTIESLHVLIHNVVQGFQNPPPHVLPPSMPHVLPPSMPDDIGIDGTGAPHPSPRIDPAMVVSPDEGSVAVVPVDEGLHQVAESAAVAPDAGDSRPRLDVVMPVKEGRFIHNKVLSSIENQGYNTRLWVSTLHSAGNIALARNQVKQYASGEFVLMHDNDIILPDGILDRMIDFLQQNANFGAVAVSKKHVPDPAIGKVEVVGHVDAGPVMWRTALLHQITYRGYTEDCPQCECLGYCEDLRAMGYEVGFLTGVIAEHIDMTEFGTAAQSDAGCMNGVAPTSAADAQYAPAYL